MRMRKKNYTKWNKINFNRKVRYCWSLFFLRRSNTQFYETNVNRAYKALQWTQRKKKKKSNTQQPIRSSTEKIHYFGRAKWFTWRKWTLTHTHTKQRETFLYKVQLKAKVMITQMANYVQKKQKQWLIKIKIREEWEARKINGYNRKKAKDHERACSNTVQMRRMTLLYHGFFVCALFEISLLWYMMLHKSYYLKANGRRFFSFNYRDTT